jgi:hypothetical protein
MSFLKKSSIRYRNDYFPAEDYKMWVDCLRYTQIFNISEVLVYYRQHDSQITQESNSVQVKMTNRIRLELLEELSSEFTEEEKLFHIDSFLKFEIQSSNDYLLYKKWLNKLLSLNKQTRAFEPIELKRKLTKHLQAGYYTCIRLRYFSEKKFFLKFFLSGEWVNLSFKYNLKLLLK